MFTFVYLMLSRVLGRLYPDSERGQATAEYALVLDCADLEPDAQAKVVQRAKDRIKKKLNRTFPG